MESTGNTFTPKQEDLSYLQDIGESENVSENCQSIDCSLLSKQIDSRQISRREILDFKNEGFLLFDVLSQDECMSFIEQGEKIGFKLIHGAKKEYRNSTRLVTK